MREVKALASINHQNIVRYYHAWFTDSPDWAYDTDESEGSSSSSNSLKTCGAGEDHGYSSHPTIVLPSDSIRRFLCVKLELCDLSLRNWIDTLNRAKIALQTILNVFFQLTVAVKFIHEREKLIHREIGRASCRERV